MIIKCNMRGLTFDAGFFFEEINARFSYLTENGCAVFKDSRGNFGTLRKRNGNRIYFKTEEEVFVFMENEYYR